MLLGQIGHAKGEGPPRALQAHTGQVHPSPFANALLMSVRPIGGVSSSYSAWMHTVRTVDWMSDSVNPTTPVGAFE